MLFALPLAYLLGSIPFGLLLTKAAGLGDVRAIGSGNIGATNVLRAGNKWLAAATLLLDAAKGFAAVEIGARISPEAAMACGVLAMLGHIFPLWLRFNGGKGVATGFGALLALNVWAGLATLALWLIVFWRSRISSFAALTAYAVAPLFGLAFSGAVLSAYAAIAFLLVLFTHRANITRLFHGTEPRFERQRS